MKKTPLMTHSRRMCGAIGLCWLVALLLRRWHLWDAAAWLFGVGAVLAVALLIMLFLQHRRDSSAKAHQSDSPRDK